MSFIIKKTLVIKKSVFWSTSFLGTDMATEERINRLEVVETIERGELESCGKSL